MTTLSLFGDDEAGIAQTSAPSRPWRKLDPPVLLSLSAEAFTDAARETLPLMNDGFTLNDVLAKMGLPEHAWTSWAACRVMDALCDRRQPVAWQSYKNDDGKMHWRRLSRQTPSS